MNEIELNIIALAASESQPGNFALILEERIGFRRLPVIIGPYETQAIALAVENIRPSRPQTHDLLKQALDAAQITVGKVVITKLDQAVFYAQLEATKPDGSPVVLDARVSDAIAMAVRCECPIFATEQVMDAAGFVLDSPSRSFSTKRGRLTDYSLEELQAMLEQVLAKEDFESASKIRNAINWKKEQ